MSETRVEAAFEERRTTTFSIADGPVTTTGFGAGFFGAALGRFGLASEIGRVASSCSLRVT